MSIHLMEADRDDMRKELRDLMLTTLESPRSLRARVQMLRKLRAKYKAAKRHLSASNLRFVVSIANKLRPELGRADRTSARPAGERFGESALNRRAAGPNRIERAARIRLLPVVLERTAGARAGRAAFATGLPRPPVARPPVARGPRPETAQTGVSQVLCVFSWTLASVLRVRQKIFSPHA